MKEKRVQIVEVHEENIGDFFRGNFTVIEGLPDDAELIRTWQDHPRQTFCFMFKSDEFPVVEEGEKAPVADIVVAERRVNSKDWHVCPNCMDTIENGDVRN